MKKRRSFTNEQKIAILQEAINERSVAKVLAKHRLGDGAFYRWQKRFMPNWEEVFKPKMDTRRHTEVSRPRVERIVRSDGFIDQLVTRLATALVADPRFMQGLAREFLLAGSKRK
jgi:transposase-like protein